MPGAAVKCSGLKMGFEVGSKTVQALAGLDLEVAAGQFHVLREQSGGGKILANCGLN